MCVDANIALTITSQLLTGAALLFGFWQLGKQHKNAIEQQNRNNQSQLKVKIYGELTSVLQDCEKRQTVQLTSVASWVHDLETYWKFRNQFGGPEISLAQKLISIDTTHMELMVALTRVTLLLEHYEILFQNQRLAKAIHSVLLITANELTVANSEFSTERGRFSPLEHTDDATGIISIVSASREPNEEEYHVLERSSRAYLDVCYRLVGYMIDLRIAAQNLLLSDISDGRTLPPRIPRNPELISVYDSDDVLRRVEKIVAAYEASMKPDNEGMSEYTRWFAGQGERPY